MCTSQNLSAIFSIIKKSLSIIQIIGPLLLILLATISFIKLIKNPNEKNGSKKVVNKFIAAVVISFVPLLVDITMNVVGDNNRISICWNKASEKNIITSIYQSNKNKEK